MELTEQDRERLRAEEIFREEVRSWLRTKEPTTWRARVWKFANSSFAIFLFSSVVLGTISWQYQRWLSAQGREAELSVLREEATVELGYRFFIMRQVLKEPTAVGRDGMYVRAVFFGQQPYSPAVARFKEVSVPAVMFVLRREKLDDPFERFIGKTMPEMSVAIQRLAGFRDDEPLDRATREQLHDFVSKIGMLSIRW